MIRLPTIKALPKAIAGYSRPEILLVTGGLAYLVISKVACTSIKASLAHIEFPGWSYEKDPYEVHHLDWVRINNAGNLPEGTTFFTVVRNPFERLVSCYKSKIISDRKKGIDSFRDYIFRPFFGDISFEQFVSRISCIPDTLAEKHFVSQWHVIRKVGSDSLDQVIRLEDIESEYDAFISRYGVKKLDRLNTTDPDDWRAYYTPTLAEKVFRRYRHDIVNLGYESEYEILQQN